MNNRICLFLFCVMIVVCSKVNGQTHLPPVFDIKADTALSQTINDKYWQLLEDPSGKLTIDEVSSLAYDAKFHFNTTKQKGYNYDVNTYWLRYKLKNTTNHPIKITIPEGVAFAWVYTLNSNNTWDIKKTGSLVPWSKRDGLKKITSFVINLQPNEETLFYEKDVFDFRLYKPKVFDLTIGIAEPVIEKNYINNDSNNVKNILSAISGGILLMAMIINLLFYNVVREKTYLYFSGFLLFYGLYFLSVASPSLLFQEHPYINIFIYRTQFLVALALFSLMHFVRQFLSTKTYTPKWDKFLIALSFIQIIPWFSIFYISPSLDYTTNLFITILLQSLVYCYVPIILITVFAYFKVNKSSRMAIIAILPMAFWFGIVYTYGFIIGALKAFKFNIDAKLSDQLQSIDGVVSLFIFLWLTIVFSLILFKRYQKLQQNLIQTSLDKERLAKEKEIERNQLIEQQKVVLEQEVEARTAELKQSLTELKTTQEQLIQSEKLASLGELTAGIAHEIQNPLNFVNNFSEVSIELAGEMKDELATGNLQLATEIASDIEQNLQKIIHHGKRADGIVKNMLQHSRNNTAEKHLTDINALADEYFRLSYHGLRAKDKSFNANMITNFDEALPKVNIIPQDIGRVLLNLINNSFYAVQLRKKKEGESFKPEVKVSTSQEGNFIKVSVLDNGLGFSEELRTKILQPFFTTKPTGEGTGLGLSLSYDIITKGHGGKIDIQSKEGEFSKFTIFIPKELK